MEVRSDRAILRNLSGAPPPWRRFECNAIRPYNPANLRFAGVDGRGRQELISDARNRGAVVVRIEDPDSGAEGYTFDLTWSGSGYPSGYRGDSDDRGVRRYPGDIQFPQRDDRYRDEDSFHRDREDSWRRENWRQRFFERIREDVEHLRSVAFSRGDQYRLRRTLHA